MSDAWNWTCPFCNVPQVSIADQRSSGNNGIYVRKSKFVRPGFGYLANACSNKDCGEISFTLWFGEASEKSDRFQIDVSSAEVHRVRPTSSAKPQPPAVPSFLAEDYYEACKIRDLSAKASATLSRRVLHGMIRDYCGIARNSLYAEITALKELCDNDQAPPGVQPQSVEAMHHVRELGNIGAHMEKDTNVIIDVDPSEAQLLIERIETIFEDWYVERAKRNERLARLKAVAEQKALQRAASNTLLTVPTPGSEASEADK